MNNYILYPKSVVQLADEIKKICNNYWENNISADEVKKYIEVWAKDTEFLFYNNEIKEENLNKSIKKIVGKKRINLIFTLLKK